MANKERRISLKGEGYRGPDNFAVLSFRHGNMNNLEPLSKTEATKLVAALAKLLSE